MHKKRFSLWLLPLVLSSPGLFGCHASLQRVRSPALVSVGVRPNPHLVTQRKHEPKTQGSTSQRVVVVQNPVVHTEKLKIREPAELKKREPWHGPRRTKMQTHRTDETYCRRPEDPSSSQGLARMAIFQKYKRYQKLSFFRQKQHQRLVRRGRLRPRQLYPPVTVPLHIPEVRQAVQYYGTTRWGFPWIVLRRFSQYKSMLTPIFQEHGMPLALMMQAGNESSFVPRLRSYKRAMGMWQVMYHTGRRFGLQITPWVDERRHVQKATHAMIRYLKFLHRRYRDWSLVIAAYNCGEGCLDRIIKRCPNMNFWQMRKNPACQVPRETRTTVPRFFALVYYWQHPERLPHKPKPMPSLQWREVRVPVPIPLQTIATVTGLPVPEIRTLNPELSSWVTPPGQSYPLRLPAAVAPKFRRYLHRHRHAFYLQARPVVQGTTLASLAKIHKIPLAWLQQLNHIRNDRDLQQYPYLLVPRGKKSSRKRSAAVKILAEHARQFVRKYPSSWLFSQWPGRLRKQNKSCYVVKKTTTWRSLGRMLKVSPRLLRRLNPGIHRIFKGTQLKLTPSSRCPSSASSKDIG